MTCDELYAKLTDLSEGILDSAVCAEVDLHLRTCQNCQAIRQDLQDLSRLCRESNAPRMPNDVRQRIEVMLRS